MVEEQAEVPTAVVPPAKLPEAGAPASKAPTAAPAPRTTAKQQAPARSSAAPPATSRGTNQVYNAQTAVDGSGSAPSWLAGL
ncbi:hypothetical protein [Pseudarthrobacter sp. NamB4]|uniref:hypothetical protein n=1 Tax=Pseudarthrobacter sp. NamB4 TaxID=2576837 RepID=UPI0010FE73EA|nr:hypothetical protein [Pseudarthrobacter sp. NamB4]TLM73788.1 hypothetical protein FDW81_07630 [Pseudarthrobacter sp. NamB4]